ncbi:MAG: serine/threonine protein kinase [Kiritimatiellia bacterium]
MNAGEDPGLLQPGGKFGDYTVVRLLGAGGMGAVYLIRGDASGNEFAVKILDPQMERSDPEFKRRFIFEAELAMSIRHENLIQVFDVGRDPETGYAYILMEYVPGGTVRDRLTKWGALSIEEAGDIVRRVARALAAVAAHNVVHRDVKPDNIMFTSDGVTPKLADLGIARLANEKTRHTAITENGFIIGSPAYMSPEQMTNAHTADIRADIHALGVTFWEMLVGRRPYEGEDTLAIVARAMKGEPIPDVRRFRSDVPAGIADLIARMTRPNVTKRIQTPTEVADELDQLLSGKAGARRGIRVPSRRERAAIRYARATRDRANRSLRIGLAAFLGSLVVGGMGLTMFVRALRPSPPPPTPVAADPLAVLTPVEAMAPELEPLTLPEPESASGPTTEEPPPPASEKTSVTEASPAPPPTKPAAKPSPTPANAATFVEAIAPELRRYAMYRRMATVPETRAEGERTILKVVNDARAIDPDMRLYDLDGRAAAPGWPPLAPAARATLRAGKIFLALELTRAECPKLMERYASEKIAATAKLPKPRPLSIDDVVALLGRAAGKDLFPLFRELGVRADSGRTAFRQGVTK